ncbi:endoribonuclease Dicer-like protein 3a [Iris pallida]|uniref:Endoribonuclease Dicer-like protein 3a n=1 Tax=Iris pallida TaxID=29817 RepID=A0AAX6DPD1_IRIPA|nr:endoribonuclease Dicer-like protein 3a [Iris pallida]
MEALLTSSCGILQGDFVDRGYNSLEDFMILLLLKARGNIQQRDLLFNIIKSKHSMMDTASHRECVSLIPKLLDIEKTEAYDVESTGARVTADSSVNLISILWKASQ